MLLSFPVLLLYLYGIILIIGGVMGYLKSNSMPSLVAGVVCGVIAILLGYYYPWYLAPWFALLLSVLLIIVMGRRYLSTRKPMPALLIIILSMVVAIVQIYVLLMTA